MIVILLVGYVNIVGYLGAALATSGDPGLDLGEEKIIASGVIENSAATAPEVSMQVQAALQEINAQARVGLRWNVVQVNRHE